MALSEQLITIADRQYDIYTAGLNKNDNDYLNSYLANGERKNLDYAFYRWPVSNFTPKCDIKPTSAHRMFYKFNTPLVPETDSLDIDGKIINGLNCIRQFFPILYEKYSFNNMINNKVDIAINHRDSNSLTVIDLGNEYEITSIKIKIPEVSKLEKIYSKYTVVLIENALNEELKKTYIYEINKEITEIKFDNLLVNTVYQYEINCGGATIKSEYFTTQSYTPRFISTNSIDNVRDIGGWKTETGEKQIKQGLIYRGAALSWDNTSKTNYLINGATEISEKDIELLTTQLKIKTEIDLRGSSEKTTVDGIKRTSSPLGSNVVYYDIALNADTTSFTYPTTTYKKIFKIMADENNYPIYFHCTGGADRTGRIAYLLNGLLGVSKEDLIRDWELSSFSKKSTRRRADTDSYWPGFNQFIELIDTYDGETLSKKIQNVMINTFELTELEVDNIKTLMLMDYSSLGLGNIKQIIPDQVVTYMTTDFANAMSTIPTGKPGIDKQVGVTVNWEPISILPNNSNCITGIYLSNNALTESDFNGLEIKEESDIDGTKLLEMSLNDITEIDWNFRDQYGTLKLEDGKKYKYLVFYTPTNGGHAIENIEIYVKPKMALPLDLTKILTNLNVNIILDEPFTNGSYMFEEANILSISMNLSNIVYKDDEISNNLFNSIFNNSKIENVELLLSNLENGTPLGITFFMGAYNLKNLFINGYISSSVPIYFLNSPNLTKSSIENIVQSLSPKGNSTCWFLKSVITKVFETNEGLNDGFESEEWLNLKNTKPNWSFKLI